MISFVFRLLFFFALSGTSPALAEEDGPPLDPQRVNFVIANTLFTAMHELGHAVIHEYELPVLGGEERAADNLAILLIRRSPELLDRLRGADYALSDRDSRHSRQPEAAANPLRSLHEEYFVAYATGTDFGCELVVEGDRLREICGSARYDFAGRTLRGERDVPNLAIPDYHFSADFKRLVIRP